MNFRNKFPVVRGIQANREYYIAMIPLGLLEKIFIDNNETIVANFRAQRRINESRIPEIKKYILENRDTYVFSALSASIDGDFEFIPYNNGDIGELNVDMDAVYLINDGQHRKAAIIAAIKEDESLKKETISIVFFKDIGLERSQQMFTDLNKYAVKPSNSLATLYDSRDEIAIITKKVIDTVDFFKRYTDKEKDNLGKNSSKLFTLNNLYKSNQRIIKNNYSELSENFVIEYWNQVSENIIEWQEVMNNKLYKKDLREDYIVTLAVTLNAFGRLGNYFYENKNLNMSEYLKKLQNINWNRDDKTWYKRTIREDGRVKNTEEAIILTCNAIKKKLNIELLKDEKLKEKHI